MTANTTTDNEEKQTTREEVWNEYEVTVHVYKTGDRMKKETVVAPDFDAAREATREAIQYEIEEFNLIKKVGEVTVEVTDEWTFKHTDPEANHIAWSTHHDWHNSPDGAKKEADRKAPDHFETEIVSRTTRVDSEMNEPSKQAFH